MHNGEKIVNLASDVLLIFSSGNYLKEVQVWCLLPFELNSLVARNILERFSFEIPETCSYFAGKPRRSTSKDTPLWNASFEGSGL